jgi:LacI family transcriptional regulator
VTTLADVARVAGVAPSTVSHVINGTRFVSEETREVVLQAITATAYTPNTLARSLARSGIGTGTVGIALSAASNPYFMNLIHAIEGELTALGKMVFLADTREAPARELDVVRSLHQRRVDGIILAPCGGSKEHALRYLMQNKVPTVLVDRCVAPEFTQVGVENAQAIRRLVDHLTRLGHQHIGMIGGQAGIATTIERVTAFKRALGLHRHPFDPSALVTSSESVAEARDALSRMLQLRKRPTAIIAGNNQSMIGIMQALHHHGVTVPEEMAVVGFDDFEWADCFHPRLTVIAQPFERIAQMAAQLLVETMENRMPKPRTIRLKPALIIRDSCGSALPNRRMPGRVLASRAG